MTRTIWILNREKHQIELTTIPMHSMPFLMRVRVHSEGEWINAYAWRD